MQLAATSNQPPLHLPSAYAMCATASLCPDSCSSTIVASTSSFGNSGASRCGQLKPATTLLRSLDFLRTLSPPLLLHLHFHIVSSTFDPSCASAYNLPSDERKKIALGRSV
ncbi:hypothetical protein EUGRSUZ_H02716 [Eucalyptus grandis]|uniref:Uncharacterized protein n=2 Tax=Eucalyptus grandis TaxID=71139 RepID=A0ACC3JTM5_EUCGR|nr:hypothetical protein EUGRSUZ_H02716 [Eucalyptus grandis]